MSGVKGRSGRKRNITNVMKYLNETIDKNWYDLVEALVDKAKQGDKESLFYCFDRRLGKPKANLEIEGVEHLGEGVILNLLTLFAQHRLNKPVIELEEGKDATE